MRKSVLSQRKELKKRSHGVVRSHYVVLVFLMLAMSLFGTEYTMSISGWSNSDNAERQEGNDPGNVLAADDVNIVEDLLDICWRRYSIS